MVISEFKKEKKKRKQFLCMALKKWLCMWISSYYKKLKSNYRMCYQTIHKKAESMGGLLH